MWHGTVPSFSDISSFMESNVLVVLHVTFPKSPTLGFWAGQASRQDQQPISEKNFCLEAKEDHLAIRLMILDYRTSQPGSVY
jgi:hypothetical protein